MTHAVDPPRPRTFRRLSWGSTVALIYVAFVTATAGVVWFAMEQPNDLVSADYYGQSLTYDARISAIENGDALGDAVGVQLDREAATLTVHLPAAQANLARGSITWYRPSAADTDRREPIALDAQGLQRISTEGMARGLWRLRLAWTVGAREFYREHVVTLP